MTKKAQKSSAPCSECLQPVMFADVSYVQISPIWQWMDLALSDTQICQKYKGQCFVAMATVTGWTGKIQSFIFLPHVSERRLLWPHGGRPLQAFVSSFCVRSLSFLLADFRAGEQARWREGAMVPPGCPGRMSEISWNPWVAPAHRFLMRGWTPLLQPTTREKGGRTVHRGLACVWLCSDFKSLVSFLDYVSDHSACSLVWKIYCGQQG